MTRTENPGPGLTQVSDSSEGESTPDAALRSVTQAGSRWRLIFSLCVAGVVCGFAIDRASQLIAPVTPKEMTQGAGPFPPEVLLKEKQARLDADYKNLPTAFGVAGLIVGILSGLGTGIGTSRILVTTGGGAIAGGILGAIGGLLAIIIRQSLADWSTADAAGQPDPLKSQLHMMALHLPTWLAIAAAAGIAVTLAGPPGGKGKSIGMACVGAFCAALLYPILVSLVFGMEDPDAIVPTGTGNRIFWATLNCGLIGMMIVFGCAPKKSGSVS